MRDKTNSSGVSFYGLLTIVFITLKLTGVIAWSWWWVLCPMWGVLLLAVLIVAIGLIVVAYFDK